MPKKTKEEFNKDDFQSDILDLMRKVVGAPQSSEITALDNLVGQEEQDFLRYCSMVVDSPWFSRVFEALYWPQILATAMQASNYDEVSAFRMSANGISLVKEYFLRKNRTFTEKYAGPKSGFEPDQPFEKPGADSFMDAGF